MDQTAIWMLGVIGFGIVFYGFSLYYQKRSTVEVE